VFVWGIADFCDRVVANAPLLLQSLNWFVKPMETLEFIIYPDGRVQEKATGIVGASCTEVTAAIEAQLGRVITQEPTSEYFAQAVHQSAVTTAQTTFSEG